MTFLPRNRAVLIALLASCSVHGQTLDLRGQLSLLSRVTGDPALTVRTDLRYLPSLFATHTVADEQSIDAELGLNLLATATMQSHRRRITDASVEPYRIWIRYVTPRFEGRVGLQKISFGPAVLFRPLMWFDAIDPRDPLQITRGVYAALGRLSVASTAGLWFWAVVGEDRVKGWESLPSKKGSAELGGRSQIPLFGGETGLSYHHRTAQTTVRIPTFAGNLPTTFRFPEDRIGIDGKWDVGPGVWFEAVLTRLNTSVLPYPWQHSVALGADYTFGVGNGLTVLGEFFHQQYTARALGPGRPVSIGALSLSYPVTILDDVSAMVCVDLRESELYAFASWRRTYDDWVIHLIAFANPSRPALAVPAREGIPLPGNGGMLTVVFNH